VLDTLKVAAELRVDRHGVVAAMASLPWSRRSEARATELALEQVEAMGLEGYRDKLVGELSTGTRRIVDLACLVAHRPTVVLLDEPSSGIAQREVEALAPVLLRLRDEMGASLLVIEHDLPLISSISDRLIALDQGEVIAMGIPADVLTHPDVVESYIGNNAAARQRSGIRG
jgi:branched-chain amino acid transport system ATP-binding protein